MSSKIKVKVNSDNGGVKIKGGLDNRQFEQESIEERIKKQSAQSYQKGFSDGQQQVKKELEHVYTEKLLEKFNQLHEIFAEFDDRVLEYEKSFEKIVIALSVEIAEKVIKRELDMKTTIEQNLKESLKKIIGANDVFVRMNPDDFSELNEEGSAFLSDGTYSRVKFEPDDRIGKGGCFVETEIGNVDSRISTQISEIQKELEATYADEIE